MSRSYLWQRVLMVTVVNDMSQILFVKKRGQKNPPQINATGFPFLFEFVQHLHFGAADTAPKGTVGNAYTEEPFPSDEDLI